MVRAVSLYCILGPSLVTRIPHRHHHPASHGGSRIAKDIRREQPAIDLSPLMMIREGISGCRCDRFNNPVWRRSMLMSEIESSGSLIKSIPGQGFRPDLAFNSPLSGSINHFLMIAEGREGREGSDLLELSH